MAAEKGRARERERGADPQIRQIASINEIEKRIDPLNGRTNADGSAIGTRFPVFIAL